MGNYYRGALSGLRPAKLEYVGNDACACTCFKETVGNVTG